MVKWKIGEVVLKDYLLKISCIENTKTIVEDELYQMVLFKKGTAILNVNGKSISITAPCVFCLSERDQLIWKNENNTYEMDIICFDPSVINHHFDFDNLVTGEFGVEWTDSVIQDRVILLPFIERKVPYGGILSIDINTFHRLQLFFDRLKIHMELESDSYWPCRSRSYLFEMLIILEMSYFDHSAANEFLELNESQNEMNNVLDYIHSNYSSKITIDLLTKQFHINRNTLTKGFTQLTGATPISYLIDHRLKVAESFLVNTRVPVHEICDRVGFSELSNFMKSFKKKYGETPANYRTLYTTMECNLTS